MIRVVSQNRWNTLQKSLREIRRAADIECAIPGCLSTLLRTENAMHVYVAKMHIPSFLSSRKEFSVSHANNVSPKVTPPEKSSGPRSQLLKSIIGGVAIGTVAGTALFYVGQHYIMGERSSVESRNPDASYKNLEAAEHRKDQIVHQTIEEPSKLSSISGKNLDQSMPLSDTPLVKEAERELQGESEMAAIDDAAGVKEEVLPKSPEGMNDQSIHFEALPQDSAGREKSESGAEHLKASTEPTEGSGSGAVFEDNKEKLESENHILSNNVLEETPGKETGGQSSLLEAYLLIEKDEEKSHISANQKASPVSAPFSKEKEVFFATGEDQKNAKMSMDGTLVLDFIEAIHAAEKKQAELDARIYDEEKRKLKERYEKNLKDARARELMYAEEAALLDKELNKERVKAEARIKSLQEKAEQNLKTELQCKEEEAKLQLKKAQELAKAELAAAIANEKASQIEKMADANLHINALCMAFYARSEEARQSHSVYKLALGALALEDALSKGLPIQKEIDAFYTSLDGVDRDSLLDLALSSLPSETLKNGTDTQLQLNQKESKLGEALPHFSTSGIPTPLYESLSFDALKGKLQHFSLIPAGGGGILTHAMAHVASSIKMKEDDASGQGIESTINRVEGLLAEGKLDEAADTLEEGVRGTRAEEIITGWVTQARNRAITEQALSLLQSYATTISLTN
ncbi:hypothetical protein ACLOJK_016138 [Asimina triloba]